MEPLHLIGLALVQGITEFLPISSSGHLVLLPRLLGWPDQGLAFDVAAHLGSLAAVVFHFRHDLAAMARAWLAHLGGRGLTAEARLAWAVLLGTIPVGLVGLLLHDPIEVHLRSVLIIAATTVGFGIALWLADAFGARRRTLDRLRWSDVAVVGVAQALALVPGTSRSGITMTAALAMGLDRTAAARFSFLLSIPVIVLAGGLEVVELAGSRVAVAWGELSAVAVLSAISAYLCIRLFLGLIERVGMWPFAIYRLVLGGLLLAWWW